jgi:hypothetical protein
MKRRGSVNWKSPITWICVAAMLAAGVAFGIHANRASQSSGAFGKKQRSRDRKRAPQPARVSGSGYSIPVPAGYHVATGEHAALAKKGNATMVVADRRIQAPGAFLGQIVVGPIQAPRNEQEREAILRMDQPEHVCKSFRGFRLSDQKLELVEFDHGTSCRLTGRDQKDPNHHAVATSMKKPGQLRGWLIYCGQDPRDPAAPAACDAVVQGFRFE